MVGSGSPLGPRLRALRQRLVEALLARHGELAFDTIADLYAWMTLQPTWRAHCGSLAERIALPLQRDAAAAPMRILDVGVGPGVGAFALAERLPGSQIVGLDYSARMLAHARRHAGREHPAIARRVALLRADAISLPFADDSFDGVTGHSLLYLIPARARVLAEVRRVLRPGARCAFVEPAVGRPWALFQLGGPPRFTLSMVLWRLANRQVGRFDEPALRELLAAAGLVDVSTTATLAGLGWIASAAKR